MITDGQRKQKNHADQYTKNNHKQNSYMDVWDHRKQNTHYGSNYRHGNGNQNRAASIIGTGIHSFAVRTNLFLLFFGFIYLPVGKFSPDNEGKPEGAMGIS